MIRLTTFALLGGLIVLSGGIVGQEKKSDVKSPTTTTKADDPPAKAKGALPKNWSKLGLSDSQKQDIYKIQNKYNPEIQKLTEKIADMKMTRDKELKDVLTAEQKKRLEDILLGKDK